MSRAREHAHASLCALLAAAAGAALVIVLPSLVMTGPDAAGSALLAVVVLTYAVLVKSGIRSVARAVPMATMCSVRSQPAPTLTARVTDRVHHPLRPRAPGLT